jgi:heat shock protein HtpX
MNRLARSRHALGHAARSVLLLGGLAALLLLPAWWLGGWPLAMFAACALLALLLAAPAVPTTMVAGILRARPLSRAEAPALHADLVELSARADLPAVPDLYLLPDERPNAVSIGVPEDAAIAVSRGLLRRLERREVAGVLAHEVSHVRSRDTRLMLFANLAARGTGLLATLGFVLLLLSLPLAMMGVVLLDWPTLLVLAIAPWLGTRLQLALSRTREYAADLDAAKLLGDPRPLAQALGRLERIRQGWLARLPWPIRPAPADPLGGTHPPSRERIRRLLELAPAEPAILPTPPLAERVFRLPGGIRVHVRRAS